LETLHKLKALIAVVSCIFPNSRYLYLSSQFYSDAESSFAQVLKLDKHCEDAMFELARVRVQQLEVCSSLAAVYVISSKLGLIFFYLLFLT